jgi:hypothetical protein
VGDGTGRGRADGWAGEGPGARLRTVLRAAAAALKRARTATHLPAPLNRPPPAKDFDLKLMDIDSEHMGIPDTEYSATVGGVGTSLEGPPEAAPKPRSLPARLGGGLLSQSRVGPGPQCLPVATKREEHGCKKGRNGGLA